MEPARLEGTRTADEPVEMLTVSHGTVDTERDIRERVDFVLITGQALTSLRSSLLSYLNTRHSRQVALPPGDSFLVYRIAGDCSN